MMTGGSNYLVGVDLGTTSTKAAIFNADGLAVAEARVDVPISLPKPGMAEQNPEDFYCTAARATKECLRESAIDPSAIEGVAFDSQMAGIGAIDEDFSPATPYDSWLDMRCQPYIDELNRHHADEITSLSGCPPTCNHGPKILWWMHERPDDFRRTAKFITPNCYVAGRACGLKADQAFIDYTFLHFTALADTKSGTWSPRLCAILGVNPDKLPRITAPWEVVGEIQPAAAKVFGLRAGTPVAAGCGDTAAGTLGAGVVKPGMLLDTAGTASVFSCCTDRFTPDRENRALIYMRSVLPDLYNPLAYVAGGGLALQWFRDHFLSADGQVDPEAAYRRLFDMAEKAPAGADGLLFCPHLGGRVSPAAPEMRGSWLGFSWEHGQAHFFRAVLESVAYEYAFYLRVIKGLLPDLTLSEARAVGSGAQSDTWNQIKADVLGIPYRRVLRGESATWGSALIAGKASGMFDDLAGRTLATARVSDDAINPNPALRTVYGQTFDRYFRWQESLEKWFRSYV